MDSIHVVRNNLSNQIRLEAPIQFGLTTLFRAYLYSVDTSSDLWEFAVSIADLREGGLTESELRWLVRKGYVEHGREVTALGDDGRAFRPTGDLTFCRRTCFVLTKDGVSAARSFTDCKSASAKSMSGHHGNNGQSTKQCVPLWKPESRLLTLNDQVVKRYKWPAVNQECILDAFQEESWPDRIDDPLSPQPNQDSKRRLSDTIKCLNRKQINELMHFRGDGTGEGVVWEINRPDSNLNGTE